MTASPKRPTGTTPKTVAKQALRTALAEKGAVRVMVRSE
jgi:hypothetical protein